MLHGGGGGRSAYTVLVRKDEGNRPLERPRHKCGII
jgi:hypothetical protein